LEFFSSRLVGENIWTVHRLEVELEFRSFFPHVKVFFNLPSSSEKNHEERIFKEDSTLATLLVGALSVQTILVSSGMPKRTSVVGDNLQTSLAGKSISVSERKIQGPSSGKVWRLERGEHCQGYQ
jgi:hypothetical protein